MLYLMFVAVPSTFEIEHVLSMREATGYFEEEYKNCNLAYLKSIAASVKESPLTVLPDSMIHRHTFAKLNDVLADLGLIIDSRVDWNFNASSLHHSGEIKHVTTFICFNLYQINKLKNFEKAVKRMVELEEYGMNEAQLKELG